MLTGRPLISTECCAAVDGPVRPAPAPMLTAAMRAWLNDPAKRLMLTRDFTLFFILKFNLHPSVAGRLLAAWVKEIA
jgi:hypothetical protein